MKCIFIVLIDEGKGPGNMTVDIQRNRILATRVLKEAEVLADNGMKLFSVEIKIIGLHGSIGKLSDAQKALTTAIERLESSLSKDQELCKVHMYISIECMYTPPSITKFSVRIFVIILMGLSILTTYNWL